MDGIAEEVLLRYEDPGEFLLNELQELYENTEATCCDVVLRANDSTTVRTHSALLAIVSPYLKTMLTEVWDPHHGATVLLPDYSGNDLRNLLRFLYTGRVSLSTSQFEVFQQLICELHVSMDENAAIILEEMEDDHQEPFDFLTKTKLPSGTVNEEAEAAEPVNNTIISLELTGAADELLSEVPSLNANGYCCDQCDAVFQHAAQLRQHKQTHNLAGAMVKETKGEVVSDGGLITEVELLLEDDSIFKKKNLVSCDLCPSAFTSQSRLNDHMLKHTGERPHKCPLCSKAYPMKATLTAHLRVHADDKPHQCERCGKAFVIRSLLEQHLRTHTDERPYSCDVCGKAFRNQSNLIGHRKTHTGDRPHACAECHKTFNRKHDLDAHSRIHSGDKPFPCSQCSKSFRFRSALRVHLRGVHGVTTNTS